MLQHTGSSLLWSAIRYANLVAFSEVKNDAQVSGSRQNGYEDADRGPFWQTWFPIISNGYGYGRRRNCDCDCRRNDGHRWRRRDVRLHRTNVKWNSFTLCITSSLSSNSLPVSIAVGALSIWTVKTCVSSCSTAVDLCAISASTPCLFWFPVPVPLIISVLSFLT